MTKTKKELIAIGFNPYYWKKSLEAQTYPMDEKEVDRLCKEVLVKKDIDVNECIGILEHAISYIDDRIELYSCEDDMRKVALAEYRQNQYMKLSIRLCKLYENNVVVAS